MEPRRRLLAGGLIAAGIGALALIAAVGGRAPAKAPPPRVEPAYRLPEGEERIVAEVLNGSGASGRARTVTRQLRRAGVDVVYFGSMGKKRMDSTLVLVRRGDVARAKDVRGMLGYGTVRVALDSTRRVDVTVMLGRD